MMAKDRPLGRIERAFARQTGQEIEPASNWIEASSLAGKPVPERQWLVKGLIPDQTVTMLGGDGGTGKSLLALQLAVAVACGGLWIGRTPVEGHALYVSAEDDLDELHRRLDDIAGSTIADLRNLTLRSLVGYDTVLATHDTRTGTMMTTPLWADIEARLHSIQPRVLVLDTLADLFSGEENNRVQARQFIGLLRGAALRHKCAVVLLSHPSLSGMTSGSGMSGSTAWNNSVRSRLYLDRIKDEAGEEADPDARRLRVMKANYGEVGQEIRLQWQDGAFVCPDGPGALDRMAARAKADRVFLHLFQIFTAQGRRLSASKGPTFAPAVFRDHPDAEGISPRELQAAMERHLSAQRLAIVEEGPPSRRRSIIVLGEETA